MLCIVCTDSFGNVELSELENADKIVNRLDEINYEMIANLNECVFSEYNS